jgi:hypothetical protein
MGQVDVQQPYKQDRKQLVGYWETYFHIRSALRIDMFS